MTERIHIRVQLEQALETIEEYGETPEYRELVTLPNMKHAMQAMAKTIDFLKAEQAAMDRFFQDNT